MIELRKQLDTSERMEPHLVLHNLSKCFQKLGGDRSAHFYSKIDRECVTSVSDSVATLFVSGILGKAVSIRSHDVGSGHRLVNFYVDKTPEEIYEIENRYTDDARNIDLIKAHIVSAVLGGHSHVMMDDEEYMKILRDNKVTDILKEWNPDLEIYRYDAATQSDSDSVIVFKISWPSVNMSDKTLALHTLHKCFNTIGGARSVHFDSRLNPEITAAFDYDDARSFICGVLGKDVTVHRYEGEGYTLINVHVNGLAINCNNNYSDADRDIDVIKAHIISAMIKEGHFVQFKDKDTKCKSYVPMEFVNDPTTKTLLKTWNPNLVDISYLEITSFPDGKPDTVGLVRISIPVSGNW